MPIILVVRLMLWITEKPLDQKVHVNFHCVDQIIVFRFIVWHLQAFRFEGLVKLLYLIVASSYSIVKNESLLPFLSLGFHFEIEDEFSIELFVSFENCHFHQEIVDVEYVSV